MSRVLVAFMFLVAWKVSALNTSTADGKQANQQLFPDVVMRLQELE